MSDIALRVEDLGKQYTIGKRWAVTNFREKLAGLAAAPFRRRSAASGPEAGGDEELFWALKDISFEVARGDVVGIIGRNGAGKSTLLKILSRITKPTEGKADIFGSIGSLLEVGTGFHPELTGRENIFLNGAILGMKRQQIERRFDEIVAFSEIGKFLDTPVKHYSSGMYTRLAFAVAANLESDILVIDEVLAVGDVTFQNKCLGKMGEVSKSGRTVLFVSHNIDAVSRLCNKGVYLSAGRIAKCGPVLDVVNSYLGSLYAHGAVTSVEFEEPPPGKRIAFRKVALCPVESPSPDTGSRLVCDIEYQVLASSVDSVIAVRIESSNGTVVTTMTDTDLDVDSFIKREGMYRTQCPIPVEVMNAGMYRLTLSAADMKSTRYDFREGVIAFEVPQNERILGTFTREGGLLVPTQWHTERIG